MLFLQVRTQTCSCEAGRRKKCIRSLIFSQLIVTPFGTSFSRVRVKVSTWKIHYFYFVNFRFWKIKIQEKIYKSAIKKLDILFLVCSIFSLSQCCLFLVIFRSWKFHFYFLWILIQLNTNCFLTIAAYFDSHFIY